MPQKSAVEPAATVLNVIRCFTLGFAQMETALVSPEMQKIVSQACGLIFEMEGRLILTGVGKSGHMARKLAATFASTGTPAYFMHAAEASHGDLGMIQSSDVLLLLSWSGETRELSDIISYGLRFDVPMIAITGGAESTLARKAQYSLVLPQAKEACPHNLAPTTSTLLQVAMGDALAITLLRMRGFSEESFRDFHPGGKLGAVLQPISDIMHESKQLPLLQQTVPIFDVIAEISNRGFGIVGLQDESGKLTGVITDGDVRRYLERNANGSMKSVMWSATAKEIMSAVSITFETNQLSAHALHVLQDRKISAAFVVENEKPIGLVTMLQLLELGVA